MKKKILAKICSNVEIAPNNFKMVISSREITREATAGQFVNLYCNRGEYLLTRPISISEVNREAGELTLIYAVLGKGTEDFSQMKEGETLRVLGPLGKGFEINEEIEDHLVVAGGIGVPPMVELIKSLKGKITVYLGFRSNPILVEAFESHGAVVRVATEDGSVGLKGNVMDLIKKYNPKPQMIYSCGPKPMLKAIAEWSKEEDIPTQISLEERMACGIGACLVCTCKTKKQEDLDWENRRVCKDGPVFWRDEVIWND